MLFVQENDKPSRLGVEGAGYIQNGRIDQFLDLCVRYWAALAQLVDGAAVRGGLDEGVGRHCWFRGLEGKLRRGREVSA